MDYKQEYYEFGDGKHIIPIIPNHSEYYKEIGKMMGRAEKSCRQTSYLFKSFRPKKPEKLTWAKNISHLVLSSSSRLQVSQTNPDLSFPSSSIQ